MVHAESKVTFSKSGIEEFFPVTELERTPSGDFERLIVLLQP
jgi:hypothetical protein